MNNECLSAVSEAGIKEGADGVWTCKHLHGYSRNYLDNQKGFFFLSFGLRDTEEKLCSLRSFPLLEGSCPHRLGICRLDEDERSSGPFGSST